MDDDKTTRKYDLQDRLLRFSTGVIQLVRCLPPDKPSAHVGQQLLRSGTSALPNHSEALAAESRRDFVHKMRLCHKELRETLSWLRLISDVPLINDQRELSKLLDEADQLVRIFDASIRTATRDPRS
ncbi:MAG: four helix bundle protein [Planctomycetota bacterium]